MFGKTVSDFEDRRDWRKVVDNGEDNETDD
jgi:hypothetical protein